MASVPRATTIYCSRAFRELWPSPLATQWRAQYPHLFDTDDLRLTVGQPGSHFCEWLAAIHLFHRDGSYSLVEKYNFGAHPRKVEIYQRAIPREVRATLEEIRAEFAVQLPDLLVLPGSGRGFSFAEVKGPGDRLSRKQRDSHRALWERLRVPIEIINVRIIDVPPGAENSN